MAPKLGPSDPTLRKSFESSLTFLVQFCKVEADVRTTVLVLRFAIFFLAAVLRVPLVLAVPRSFAPIGFVEQSTWRLHWIRSQQWTRSLRSY